MDKKIIDFVAEEKRFSEFKIKTLERTSSPSKLRLIKKERDFLSFDFCSIDFSSVEECRDAMNLFRLSKHDFLKKYSLCDNRNRFDAQCQFLLNKIKDIKIDDVGIIDGHSFASLSGIAIFNSDGTIRSKYGKFLAMCKETLNLIYCLCKENGRIPESIIDIFDYIHKGSSIAPYIYSNIQIISADDFESIVHKTESTSLLITSMNHTGNEKINIIFSRFVNNEGALLLPKKNKFVNVSVDGSYKKSIIFDRSVSESIDFEKSIVGVGKSRRFSEQLLEIKVWARIILLELEEI